MYIYLLLEFQSQPDTWMAMRMLVYVGLLYQGLVKERHFTTGPKLPPVFPLVLYNGIRPWRAPQEAAELIEALPGGLAHYRPNLRYLLLDEGSYAEQDLPPSENLAAALFRMENSRAPEELRTLVRTLAQWIHAPEQASLRRAFTVWLKRVLMPGRLPQVKLPEITDLSEIDNMLAERVQEWTQQWKAEGRKEGEITLMIRLLEKRFGPLDETTRARLEAADAEQLLHWGERLLVAESLEAVFQDDSEPTPDA